MSNIEPDRRSAVSSFYGGRRSSVDMLNTELRGGGESSQRSRRGERDRDDASSFFSPHMQPQGQGAGYNQDSFYDGGRTGPVKGARDEEEAAAFIQPQKGQTGEVGGWDVFADFNNAGPKYSSTFVTYDEGYASFKPFRLYYFTLGSFAF